MVPSCFLAQIFCAWWLWLLCFAEHDCWYQLNGGCAICSQSLEFRATDKDNFRNLHIWHTNFGMVVSNWWDCIHLVGFAGMFYKDGNFCEFLFAFQQPILFWKEIYFKRQNICYPRESVFSLKNIPFLEGRKNDFDRVASSESVSVPLIKLFYQSLVRSLCFERTFYNRLLPTVLSTSLGKILFAWRFILMKIFFQTDHILSQTICFFISVFYS